MNEKTSKNRAHFNFADALIVTVLLFVGFFTVLNVFFGGSFARRDTEIVITLDDGDAAQIALSGISASKGSEVCDALSGERIGTLGAAYAPGDKTITILLDESALESGVYVYGESVGVRVGKLICKNALVSDIREVE